MEGSSSNTCIYCKVSSSNSLINGWKCWNGDYAQLCLKCYSLYKAGLFCEAFHADEQGWRDCNSCKKLIHCGCIVSLSDYSLDDYGGIICVNCSSFFQAQNGLNDEANPLNLEMQSNSTACSQQKISEEPVVDLLFEEVVSATDAKYSNNSIVIPTKHAEAHFPEVSHGQEVMLNMLDTEGKELHLHYNCWVQGNHKTYVLQGLKNMQAGDTVAFYKRRSDEKMIIELRKSHAAIRSCKASTSRANHLSYP